MGEVVKQQTPCIICKVSIVEKEYERLKNEYPYSDIYYAVKANPGIPLLKRLNELGASFDVASRNELDMILGVGVTPNRISYGNTIKKQEDINYAFSKGIKRYATDSEADVIKLAKEAPGSDIYVRILLKESGVADWPLSKKFGCSPDMAKDLLVLAKRKGLNPVGVSFHVGSQQRDTTAWDSAIEVAHGVFTAVEECRDEECGGELDGCEGLHLTLLNIGGGLPARYLSTIPPPTLYKDSIKMSLTKHFGDRQHTNSNVCVMMEPGRSLVGGCGIIVAQIITVTRKQRDSDEQWVFVDCGIYGGMSETSYVVKESECDSFSNRNDNSSITESTSTSSTTYTTPDISTAADTPIPRDTHSSMCGIQYPFCLLKKDKSYFTNPNQNQNHSISFIPSIIAGPTCDSIDTIYNGIRVMLPDDLEEGDKIIFMTAGAYTITTASVSFNGIPPPSVSFIQ